MADVEFTGKGLLHRGKAAVWFSLMIVLAVLGRVVCTGAAIGRMNPIGTCDICKGRVLTNRGAVCTFCGHAIHYRCSGKIS